MCSFKNSEGKRGVQGLKALLSHRQDEQADGSVGEILMRWRRQGLIWENSP